MEDFNKKITDSIANVKEFIHDPATKEKAQEIYYKVKDETVLMVEKVKDKIVDLKQDEKIKDFFVNASEKIDSTISEISESEPFGKVKESVSEKIDLIKNDDKLKTGISKVKKTTLSFAQKALSKIENMLDEEEKKDMVIHEIDVDEPEQ